MVKVVEKEQEKDEVCKKNNYKYKSFTDEAGETCYGPFDTIEELFKFLNA